MYEGENDKVKMMVLLCGEEDENLVKAAAGVIATLSSRPLICKKVVAVSTTVIYKLTTSEM